MLVGMRQHHVAIMASGVTLTQICSCQCYLVTNYTMHVSTNLSSTGRVARESSEVCLAKSDIVHQLQRIYGCICYMVCTMLTVPLTLMDCCTVVYHGSMVPGQPLLLSRLQHNMLNLETMRLEHCRTKRPHSHSVTDASEVVSALSPPKVADAWEEEAPCRRVCM